MTPIYLLVTGMYDSYSVLGVYTNRAEAETIAETINGADPDHLCDARVESVPLNPDMADVMADALYLTCDDYDAQLKDYERRKREAGIED